MKLERVEAATVTHLAYAKAPYRKFISYGIGGYSKIIPQMLEIMQETFAADRTGAVNVTSREFGWFSHICMHCVIDLVLFDIFS